MASPGQVVADALGVLLQRNFRTQLYAVLVDGVHDAVDAASYPVLSGVARLQPVTAAALGSAVGLDRSVVSRRAAALTDAGLLDNLADPDDRRANLLSLSPAGDTVVAALRERLVNVLDDRLNSWPTRDRAQFAALLNRFVADGPI